MKSTLLPALLLIFLSGNVCAMDVAGVSVPSAAMVNGKALALNGAGVRKKLFLKVYVGALYTVRKVATRDELLRLSGDRLIRMTFVMGRVGREKIVDAFNEGLANNAPEAARTPEAKLFLSHFTEEFVKGDAFDVVVGDDGTVSASHNGRLIGSVRSPVLARGVLLIWFGDKPADEGLKRGMLGRN